MEVADVVTGRELVETVDTVVLVDVPAVLVLDLVLTGVVVVAVPGTH